MIINLLAEAERVYSTTALCYFCTICLSISDKLKTIGKEIKQMPYKNFHPNKLKILKNNHVQLCRAIEFLNASFGPILLLEILFISIDLTNDIMDIFLQQEIELYNFIMRVLLIITFSVNLAFICYSAETIRTEVIIKTSQIQKTL